MLHEAFKNIHPDELSPKQALEALYHLKQLEKIIPYNKSNQELFLITPKFVP